MHRDGDWHRALHLWVILPTGRVVLQRRSVAKDTHPGLVDVSVAGHLRAGEDVAEALRESEEEIGLVVRADETFALGMHRVERGTDREVHTVLGVHATAEFASLRPDADEVAALYAADVDAVLELEHGRRDALFVEALDTLGVGVATLHRDDFVPDPAGYRAACLERLAAHLRGAPFERLALAP